MCVYVALRETCDTAGLFLLRLHRALRARVFAAKQSNATPHAPDAGRGCRLQTAA